jgi:hypothetical protein
MNKIIIENSYSNYDTDATRNCVLYLRDLFEFNENLLYIIQLSDYPKLGIEIDYAFYAKNSFQIDQAIKAFFAGFKYGENRFNQPFK